MENQLKSYFHRRPWLPKMAPHTGLALTALVALVLVLAAALVSLQQPSLGLEWGPSRNNSGLVVQKSAKPLPADPPIQIAAIKGPDGRIIKLHNGMLIEDPDQLATFAAFNHFFIEQHLLMDTYSQESVVLVTRLGREWPLEVQFSREWSRLPVSFWILNLSAAVCFLVGCGVWWYRRGEYTGRLMAVVAIGYFLSILCLSVYGTRELVMDPGLFRSLSAANRFFTITWCYSLLLLFATYPFQIGSGKLISAAYLFILVLWLNQTLQWYEFPIHAFYLTNHIIPYGVATILGIMQWRRTARNPVERAALRWFILSIWISIGLAGSLFVIPGVTRNAGAIPLWIPSLSILLMFICFAFGILRFGLFNLERWWFAGWVWLASGLLIAGIDLLLYVILDVSFRSLLPVSILLLGWIYFPLRHWLWTRLVHPESYQLEHHLPLLIRSLFESRSMQSFADRWSELLKQVFNPLNLLIEQSTETSAKVLQHGLILEVPGLDGRWICRLIGNRQGTRLFGPKDVELAEVLLNLSQAIYDINNKTREVQKKGAAEERERIMRDLHDDVLPKLITIKHQSSNGRIERLAEAAFQSLRETIYILRYPSPRPLTDVLADWRGELAERLDSTRLKLHWHPPEMMNGLFLQPRQFIHCGRILREAVSNIIQHADAHIVRISFDISKDRFHMTVSDNGQGADMNIGKGLGIPNMRSRAKALEGEITFSDGHREAPAKAKGLTIAVSFPLINNLTPGSQPESTFARSKEVSQDDETDSAY